jgi:hypothetical protein
MIYISYYSLSYNLSWNFIILALFILNAGTRLLSRRIHCHIIYYLLWNFFILALFILNAGTRMLHPRIWIILGALLIPAGYLLNAFAPNVAFLILSQGVLFGTLNYIINLFEQYLHCYNV